MWKKRSVNVDNVDSGHAYFWLNRIILGVLMQFCFVRRKLDYENCSFKRWHPRRYADDRSYDYSDQPQIIIWNPSTRKSVTLPKVPKPQYCFNISVYGFGAHPTTREYKAFLNGVVHWVASDPWKEGGLPNSIMLFDMASESFSEIMLPPTLAADQNPKSLSIHVFGESLAVSCTGERDGGAGNIWLMKEYGVAESWTKLFSSILLGMPNKTLGFRKNGEGLLASANSLASYAPGTITLAKTGIIGTTKAFYVDPFTETLLSVQFGDEYSEVEFPFKLPFAYDFRVVGSYNGLLCLSDKWLCRSYGYNDQCQIFIWNPSTRKSVTLPTAPKPHCPNISVYGFGAHPTTQEYKVIRLEYKLESLFQIPQKVEIYTQGTRSWRVISSAPPPHCFVTFMWSQAFLNGIVHWVARDPCVEVGFRNLVILFDMASESFSEIMLPPTLASNQNPKSLSIHVFGESLAVSCTGERDGDAGSIWLMKEYGVAESWTKLFSSKLLGMPNKTLGFRKNGEVLLASANSLASYAPGTITLAKTGIIGTTNAFYVDPFMETLLSVE
ncbi:hypothetical protein RHGRI_010081 [Rhododendron griersonianum]|uniref:F-box associated beta-propeller type 1 domain-containing protein n=1 Tax=Rhododendron griersonianum TaxID=479676 RepID=A0AAV6KH50_9ERIC|nr:hypothetical protein RHGRI_010081 [Rhododendron griersonianum]